MSPTNSLRRPASGRMPCRAQGLTLIELLIAMVIVVLLATVGVPSMRGLMADQHRVAATNDLVAAMNLARSEALKRTRHVSICASADGANCVSGVADWRVGWIVFANTASTNTGTFDADEELLRSFGPINDGATFKSPDGLPAVLAFRPTGDVDTAGTLVYCDGRDAVHARAVVLERAGRAYVSGETFAGEALNCD